MSAVIDADEQPESARRQEEVHSGARPGGLGEPASSGAARRSRRRDTNPSRKGWFGGDESQALAFYGEFYRS